MKQDGNVVGSDNGELGGRRGLMLVLSSPSGAGKTTGRRTWDNRYWSSLANGISLSSEWCDHGQVEAAGGW